MKIQECYQQLGGDFAKVEKQLLSANLVKRFITKFLDDASFSELCIAMQEGNRNKAFRAAHALKGVSGNLGMNRLFSSVSQLTELLRPEAEFTSAGVNSLFEEVKQDYMVTVHAIRAYLDSDS